MKPLTGFLLARFACGGQIGERVSPLLSAAFHKYGDAPRAARRPPRKARGGRIPRVFDRRATPRGGMHRRPNATVFMKVSTKTLPQSSSPAALRRARECRQTPPPPVRCA